MADLRVQLQRILTEECQFSREDPLVIGVSGGADSLCLFDLLAELRYSILVGHLDHALRPGSAVEAARLRALVEAGGIPFASARVDVSEAAAARRMSIEEAGRLLRYEFLFGLAEQHQARAVLVGHHAGDQVETLLMHLLRGAGAQGLRAMQPVCYLPQFSQDVPLVRPLLSVSRKEILEYCEERGLEPVIDETNADTRLHRNRIRHELIPYLETYNPRVRDVLQRSAQVLTGEYEIIQAAVEQSWDRVVEAEGIGWIKIRRAEFLASRRPLQRAVFREMAARVLPETRDLSFETTEQFIQKVESPPRTGQARLTSGMSMILEGEIVWLAVDAGLLPNREWAQIDPGASLALQVPGEVRLGGGWSLEAATCLVGENGLPTGMRPGEFQFEAVADAGRVRAPLVVRSRRAGERFPPLGLAGRTQKVSDFMINEKIPARARPGWPLVVSGEEIVWVPGFRLAETFRVTSETREGLRLRLVPPAD